MSLFQWRYSCIGPDVNLSEELLKGQQIHCDGPDGAVYILPDKEHFVKTGPTDLIAWEFLVYSRVQDNLHFPTVCERLVDFDGSRAKRGLLLHFVLCFRDIFEGKGVPPPRGRFSYVSTALCASHLIRSLRLMHRNGVLHRDIHPGNVGLLCAPSKSLPADDEQFEEMLGKGYLFKPTFIDYQWSTLDNFHPRLDDMPTMAMWSYLSDRVLREPETYSPADDLESLAYTLLEFRLKGNLPWRRKIEAKSSPFHYDVDSPRHRHFVIRTRARYLKRLCDAASPWSNKAEKTLLDFIQYARNLGGDDVIDYRKWEDVFQEAICNNVLSLV